MFARGRPPGDIPRVDAQAAAESSDPPSRWGSAALVLAFWLAALAASGAVAPFRSFELDRFFVPKELALHCGALVVALVLTARRGDRRYTLADLALGAWLIWSVVSALLATSGWHAARALAISLSAGAVFWGATALRADGRARQVVLALAAASAIAVASALAQAYGYGNDLFAANRAPGGLLGNRNFIAHVAAMALPLFVFLAATSRSSLGSLIGAAAILASSAALVLSRSRAAWLALAVWLLIAVPVAWQGRGVIKTAMAPRRGLLLAGALATGLLLALVLPNALDWRSDSPYLDSVRGVVNYRDGSGAGRLKQYTNSLKIARANPVVGVGPGNWAAEYPGFAVKPDPSISESSGMTANPWPSSDWVAAIAERGIPAALAMATLLIVLLMNAWRGWRDSVFPSAERFGALAGGSAVLIGVVEGGLDAVSLLAFPSIILWGAAGAMIPAGRAMTTRRFSPRARAYLLGATAIVWTGIVAMTAGKLEAMRLYSCSTLESVRAAATYDPGSYRIQMRAAELLAERGMCRLAYHNAMAARGLFPRAAAPEAVLAKCAGSTR
ncbi:MAG: O-antigen ligase family protein [Gemmatimonadetes bacterium]|nr:O-antigen ligase family protein [Gemmatimonadota bacterium]